MGVWGFRGLGFRGLEFRGLGFRGLGFRGSGFRENKRAYAITNTTPEDSYDIYTLTFPKPIPTIQARIGILGLGVSVHLLSGPASWLQILLTSVFFLDFSFTS